MKKYKTSSILCLETVAYCWRQRKKNKMKKYKVYKMYVYKFLG